MSTTYSYSISNCYRDNTNIVDEIFVKWTASKTDTGVMLEVEDYGTIDPSQVVRFKN